MLRTYYVVNIKKYFLDKEKQKSCNTSTSRIWNLKRHVCNNHKKSHELFEKACEEAKRSSSSTHKGPKPSKQLKLDKFVGKSSAFTKTQIQNSIIEMVVKDSAPFHFFSLHGFKSLIGEVAENAGVSLDRDNVRKMVMDAYKVEKSALKTELQGRFFHLKIDGCTRTRVNYVALNVRFVKRSGELVTKTIAVRDSKDRHDSFYLRSLIIEVLDEYELSKDQVISIVSDNASNMVKTVKKLNEEEEDHGETEEDAEADQSDREEEEFGGAYSRSSVFDDEENEVSEFFEAFPQTPAISHMRCGAHTLQLAIRDGLKE